MLAAANITVERGGRRILEHASLTVTPGRVTALLGPNGAGKSTLLHVIAGDLAPDVGHVNIDGADIGGLGARALARRRAVLTQHSLLDFPFSAHEVVVLGRSACAGGWADNRADHVAARRAMAALDIADKANQLYTSLSGGEQQRVHLARVFVQLEAAMNDGSRFLLLDEPTTSLDVAHAHLALDFAREAARRGAGVLVVLHDLQLAAFYADEAAVLEHGRVVASGPVDQVLTAPLVERVYRVPCVAITAPELGGRVLVVSVPRQD